MTLTTANVAWLVACAGFAAVLLFTDLGRYLLRRLALTIPTFVLLMGMTFAAVRLIPGDPCEVRKGERGITAEQHAECKRELGLDRHWAVQFGYYVGDILRGDFGKSFRTSNYVLDDFLANFPATLELGLCAMLFASFLGVPAGALAAVKRGSWYDQTLMGLSVTGFSMPIFWWGLVLIMLMAFPHPWNFLHGLAPVSGRIDLIKYDIKSVTGLMLVDTLLSGQKGAFRDALHHLVLPTIVLGTVPLAVIARITRSSMLEVLCEDYVRTARAKGLVPSRVVGLHALRNALIPVVTVIGLSIGSLMAGAVLTETIFSWPGVGSFLIEAISQRDYPALQGAVLLISTMIIVINLCVDLLYALINPRIRHGG